MTVAGQHDEERNNQQQRFPGHGKQRKKAKQRDNRVAFRHQQEGSNSVDRRRVNRLEQRAPPSALVDPMLFPGQQAYSPAAVDPAAPVYVTDFVVFFRPFLLQECFRPTIAELLLEKFVDRATAVMPHHGCGIEADLVAASLQPPADVNVVPGCSIAGVETADRFQTGLAEAHVDPGYVLGDRVGQQHMVRVARHFADAGRFLAVVLWGEVGAADTGERGGGEGMRQVMQPMGVGVGVVVYVGDDLAGCGTHAGVAGSAESFLLEADDLYVVASGDVTGGIGGAVVDDDDLVIRVLQPGEVVEALTDGGRTVIAGQYDGDTGPGGGCRKWNISESVADFFQGRLWLSVPVNQAEIPIEDFLAAAVPFVGPGKGKRSGAALGKCGAQLPFKGLCLLVFAVPDAVQTDFGEHERLSPTTLCSRAI